MHSSSLLLFAFGAAILLSANVYLIQSGWITEAVDNKPAITGVYPLDLLLRFFPELHANAATQLVMDVMTGFGGTVITLITFELYAQRISNKVNALYMPIAQFVALGFATPVFLGLLQQQQPMQQRRRPVSKVVAYTVFFTLVFTGVLGNMLQQGDIRVLIAFLLLPVITIPTSLLLDGGGEQGRDSIGAEEMSYQLCVVNGIVAHYKMIYALATSTALSVSMLNPPSVFLLLDLLGVVGGAYIWIAAQNDQYTAKLLTPKSIAQLVLLGPGAHFALLCLDRSNKAKRLTT